ncbi:hypothetical protein Hypma_002377 [Hypsizygus marmoreus]|uniref:Uncharacterized protein n=1 Tax=Hypsizygus marmoreus TaxID=39966 RepID=A0A369J5Z8_HYPMA|nr:hypothetical protein Hypma_002377 [Hypsizygus marmoreus]
MVNHPSRAVVDIVRAVDEIRPLIERWLPFSMREFAAIYPAINVPKSLAKFPETHLSSVACVFCCTSCAVVIGLSSPGSSLVGWDATNAHRRKCNRLHLVHPFVMSERGCVAAVSLLEELAFGPQTTLPKDLDEHHKLFVCRGCSPKSSSKNLLSWSECISHFIATSQMHSTPSWRVALPDEISLAKELEEQGLRADDDNLEYAASLFQPDIS